MTPVALVFAMQLLEQQTAQRHVYVMVAHGTAIGTADIKDNMGICYRFWHA